MDLLPPCNDACPAGENIQAWLAHAQAGDYEAAWRELVSNNPLPAVHGRVCYHPCEDACNRGLVDEPINIRALKRFITDQVYAEPRQPVESAAVTKKKPVAIIGAGFTGLTAAHYRLGHSWLQLGTGGP